MFAIEISLLTGRYYASVVEDPDEPEWPPHPARLFLALVAVWADAGEDDEERRALEWLENQEAPSIAASQAWERTSVKHYVPVNDTTGLKKGKVKESVGHVAKGRLLEKEVLLDIRPKQERSFPSVTPAVPTVSFSWDVEIPSEQFIALDALTARLTRLGRSASLVSCVMRTEAVASNWVPDSDNRGDQMMRWVDPGQLAVLENYVSTFEKGLKTERPRALTKRSVPYKEITSGAEGEGEETLSPNTSGDCYFFEIAARSRKLPVTQGVRLARAFRGAVMRYAEDPIPEGISGHRQDGTPSAIPHLVIAALPHVGMYGDGRLMGLMLQIPDLLNPADKEAAKRAIANWEKEAEGSSKGPDLELTLGKFGAFRIRRLRRGNSSTLNSLKGSTWSKRSRFWRSVTPIALPVHPGSLHRGTAKAREKAWVKAEDGVRRSCAHVGLPDPAMVNLLSDPLWEGSRPVGEFPLFEQGANRSKQPVRREQVHAEVLFDKPVKGPLLLGAGRYLGLGLMRPVPIESLINLSVPEIDAQS